MKIHLQGHRGARGNRPENTFTSIEYALDCQVDSIETDLHLCADENVILFHDHFFQSNKSSHQYLINEFTLKSLQTILKTPPQKNMRFPMQEFQVGPISQIFCNKHGLNPWAPPTLGQFFDFVDFYASTTCHAEEKHPDWRNSASSLCFDLEIKQLPYLKCKSEIILNVILEECKKRNLHDRMIVRSFDHNILEDARRILPFCKLGLLTDGTIQTNLIKEMRDVGATLFCPKFDTLNNHVVNLMHENHFKVLPWTANHPDEWQLLERMGVDGITTDYPGEFRKWCFSK